MRANNTIRNISSSLLICLFALSITPKTVIHNLIANHRDSVSYVIDGNGHQISEAGFNCHFENLVAESPFVNNPASFEWTIPFQYYLLQEHFSTSFFSQPHFFSELRGPPCMDL